jgi:UDP-N-acetylmuramoylalanine--D-glutamate ligase
MEARRRGLLVVSEIEAASWFCQVPIVAVTGSNGKTTTVEWLGDLFRRTQRDVAVCGNVGYPFSQVAELIQGGVAVVEVSSFQLEDVIRFRPEAAIITNFSPDHLDRYEDYEDYLDTKCRIFENQGGDDALIYNRGDAEVSFRVKAAPSRLVSFGLDEPHGEGAGVRGGRLLIRREGREIPLMDRRRLALPGDHNLENALAVACAAAQMDVPAEIIIESLTHFPGVPHRMETVLERNGIRWINDSKATNIASGMVALKCFKGPVILLVGGRDKGSDFHSVASTVGAKVRRVILFGEAGPAIEEAWKGIMSVTLVKRLKEAVALAAKTAEKGDTILLSPMCASFDEFDNYEHRGNTFKELVRDYAAQE